MLRRKKSRKDLKKHYFIFMQIGLVVALAVFLVAFEYNMGQSGKDSDDENKTEKQEVIKTKEVVQTKHKDKPPKPPSPQPPVEVPNDEILKNKEAQEKLMQFDDEISSGKKLSVPPPPEQEKEEKIFKVVEQQPQLIGGMKKLQEMIDYPDMARKAGVEGRVYVQFIVNEKGNVEDPKVIRGPGAGLNKEAIRVLKNAEFKPGLQRGRPVKVKMSMPIIFKLNS